MKQREYAYDNLKFLLIIFVIAAHFSDFYTGLEGDGFLELTAAARGMYGAICIFVMPAFVFVSGLFAKSALSDRSRALKKVGEFLLLYVLCKVFLGLPSMILRRTLDFNLFSESGIPWFMLCMAWWFLATWILKRFILSDDLRTENYADSAKSSADKEAQYRNPVCGECCFGVYTWLYKYCRRFSLPFQDGRVLSVFSGRLLSGCEKADRGRSETGSQDCGHGRASAAFADGSFAAGFFVCAAPDPEWKGKCLRSGGGKFYRHIRTLCRSGIWRILAPGVLCGGSIYDLLSACSHSKEKAADLCIWLADFAGVLSALYFPLSAENSSCCRKNAGIAADVGMRDIYFGCERGACGAVVTALCHGGI